MAGYRRHPRWKELFQKQGSSKWWAFIPNPEGGRQLRESTGHTDDRAAHAWYLDRIRAPARQTHSSADEARLDEALKRRLGERAAAGRAAGTIDCYTKKGRHLVRLLGAGTLLSAIGAREVDEYVVTRLGEHAARTTIYKELVCLRGCLKLARRQGYAVRAVEEVMPEFAAKYKPRERALSLEEIGRLLANLAPHRAAIVAFILATGSTYPSEVSPLRRADIDLVNWMVRLRGTKRDTRDRRVPVVSFARPWLTMAVGYMPFRPWSNVRRDLHEACERAGIAQCSPNDLRRSIATLMRARGVEPSLIGAYLGHADSRMAERVYGRLAPDQLQHLLEQRLRKTKG